MVRHEAEVARSDSVRGELVLRRRFDDSPAGPREVLELRAGGVFVMDTAETTSERALAQRALAEVAARAVLVGGLGLGFTLQEVLASPTVERVTVAEIEPALVDWLRAGVVPHGPPLLADPRVDVVVGDLADVDARSTRSAYDLVLLDVDNGPGQLVHEANAGLYRPPFLRRIRGLLRPGGALVVWSAAREPGLAATLGEVFAEADEIDCPVTLQGRREHYWLYVGRVGGR